MVNGVSASPEVVRREGEYTDRTSDPIVYETMVEEGAMTAIMLDHKQPQRESLQPAQRATGRPSSQDQGLPTLGTRAQQTARL